MKFPAVALKIWLVFSVSLLLYSVLQTAIYAFQIRHYSVDEYLKLFAMMEGTVVWTDTPANRSEVRRQLEDLYFSEALIGQILADLDGQRESEARYSWEEEGDELTYILAIGERDDVTAVSLSYIWNAPMALRRLLGEGLMSSVWALVVMLVPAYLVALGIVRPLLKMRDHALQIAERDFSVPIVVKRKDEIGTLGTSLETMRRQLQEQDEAQHKFFQAVSHEMKTPIMVIRSHVQALEDNIGSPERNLRIIDEEAEQLSRRIAKLVSLSKVEYLASHGDRDGDIDVAALLEETAERLGAAEPHKTRRVHGDVGPIRSSRELVGILFENILDNQLRYCRSVVDMDLREERGMLRVDISNDGPPVPDREREQIFAPFYTGKGGSSGLGLAIAAEICRVLGGEIRARNREGRTHFVIELPRSHNSP